MDAKAFNAVQPLLDKIAEIAGNHLETEAFRRIVADLANVVGGNKVASVSLVVEVFDEESQNSLPLLTTGLSAYPGKEAFRTWGDSTPQRYVVEDGIRVVPHDRCPNCWRVWDFKLQGTSCNSCGLALGDKCKLLLDTDECPWCNEGKVTVAEPKCDKCGHEVDRQKVIWG